MSEILVLLPFYRWCLQHFSDGPRSTCEKDTGHGICTWTILLILYLFQFVHQLLHHLKLIVIYFEFNNDGTRNNKLQSNLVGKTKPFEEFHAMHARHHFYYSTIRRILIKTMTSKRFIYRIKRNTRDSQSRSMYFETYLPCICISPFLDTLDDWMIIWIVWVWSNNSHVNFDNDFPNFVW